MSKFLNAPKGIVLFGMGTVGQAIARLLAERQWRVVAAVNRQGQKVGRDLGELAGAPALAGISVADSDGCDFAAFEADVAIIAISDRLHYNAPYHQRLLDAGLNVILSLIHI